MCLNFEPCPRVVAMAEGLYLDNESAKKLKKGIKSINAVLQHRQDTEVPGKILVLAMLSLSLNPTFYS